MFAKARFMSIFGILVFLLIQKCFTSIPSEQPSTVERTIPAAISLIAGTEVTVTCTENVSTLLRDWLWWYYHKKNDLFGSQNEDDLEEYDAMMERDINILENLPIQTILDILVKETYTGQVQASGISPQTISMNKVNARDAETDTIEWVETYVQISKLKHDNEDVVFIPLPDDAYPYGKAVATAYSVSDTDHGGMRKYQLHCLITGF